MSGNYRDEFSSSKRDKFMSFTKSPGLANQLRITDRITKVAYHFERLS